MTQSKWHEASRGFGEVAHIYNVSKLHKHNILSIIWLFRLLKAKYRTIQVDLFCYYCAKSSLFIGTFLWKSNTNTFTSKVSSCNSNMLCIAPKLRQNWTDRKTEENKVRLSLFFCSYTNSGTKPILLSLDQRIQKK